MAHRPRLVLDLRRGRTSPFKRISAVVVLPPRRTVTVPLRRVVAGIVVVAIFLSLGVGSAFAPGIAAESYAAQAPGAQEENHRERQALEGELRRLEGEIAEQEQTIQTLRTQGKTLQSEINQLNAQSRKFTLQIKAVEFTLAKLDDEIRENTDHIRVTEGKLALHRGGLTRALQALYESDQHTLLEILLRNPTLSDFFGDVSDLLAVQSTLASTIERVQNLKTELLDEQESLALQKNDAETLRLYRDAQRRNVEQVKQDRNRILAATKGKESKYQELLKETRKTAAQIRSRIFELLGGGELTFDEAYKFAKFAEQATGVRAALILAVLDRESKLGENVGRCSYKTAMHPTRDLPIFLALTSALGVNPETVTVSCPNRDGLYGGAMGPAQFIPSTWNIYKDRIAEFTGSTPPSPWRNADAFMGTALFLKDAGAAGATRSGERAAAAKYYAGRRWQRHVWGYGERVVARAQQFEQDIAVLTNGRG